MKPLKERVSLTLDNDVVAAIKRLAEEDDRSFSQYVNKILREYLRQRPQTDA
ncbi:MAG: ribbon-helix-helix protein, CopG family [Clostridia bacterium]|nr:ribbon-helix-helix protein, CopG family [Lachnospiraceae bacterium]MBQ7542994.1 ribbon-helix-helix protein, CopG family [Clostridia bacterium]